MDTLKKGREARALCPESQFGITPNVTLIIEEITPELPPGADRLIFFDELPAETPPEKRPPGVELSDCGNHWVQYLTDNDNTTP